MEFFLALILTFSLPNFKIVKTVDIPLATKIIFTDLNRDGAKDILASTSNGLLFFQNDNHGLYVEIPVSTSAKITDFETADLNGDGSEDIAILEEGKELKILKNTGIDGFTQAFDHTLVSSGFTSLAVVDFNRDGILDLYLSNPGSGDVVFLGEGGFEYVPVALQSMSRKFIPIKNQSGVLEYLLASDSSLKTFGKEKGIPPQVFEVRQQKSSKIEVADMNNDGRLDIVSLSPDGTLSIMDDSSEVIADNVADFSVSDFDMDTYEDIAVLFTDHSFSILRNTGNGNFEPNTFVSISEDIGRASSIFECDFNNDNIPDVAFYDGDRLILAENELQDAHFVALKIYPVSNSWLSVARLYSNLGIETRVFKGDEIVFSAPQEIDSIEIYSPDSGITVLYDLVADTTYKISLSAPVAEIARPDSGLLKLYPNPTGALTSIEYNLKSPVFVKIELINSGGQTLYLIDSGFKGSGTHRLLFNTEDLKPGTYFIRAILGKKVYQKKLIVLK